MVVVMGIDPSLTATGIVVLEGNVIKKQFVIKNRNVKEDVIKRVRNVLNELNAVITDTRTPLPDLIVIEGFSYASTGKTLFQNAYLGYRIREELENIKQTYDVPWIEITPTQLKKFVAGKGNVHKDVILQQIFKRWGVEFNDNNIADAYVLAKAGQAYLGYNTGELTEFQREVLQRISGNSLDG